MHQALAMDFDSKRKNLRAEAEKDPSILDQLSHEERRIMAIPDDEWAKLLAKLFPDDNAKMAYAELSSEQRERFIRRKYDQTKGIHPDQFPTKYMRDTDYGIPQWLPLDLDVQDMADIAETTSDDFSLDEEFDGLEPSTNVLLG